MKKIVTALMCMFLLCFCAINAAAQQNVFENFSVLLEDNTEVQIQAFEKGEDAYIILPSFADISKVSLKFSCEGTVNVIGKLQSADITSQEKIDLVSLCGNEFPMELTLSVKEAETEQTEKIMIYKSENLYSMFLLSEDPINKGREWVESAYDKSNKAKGNMMLFDGSGNQIYNGGLTQIKGRGNSTWAGLKKPYQIKLSEKEDLLCTGNENNKSKTWVLLASYFDITLYRNKFIYDLAYEMGVHTTPESKVTDLYYDGQYRGTYLLSEKVEVGKGRVEISDLEKQNEENNPDIEDFDDLEIKQGITERGTVYYYCDGMADGEDITGGYLLEEDYPSRAVEEISYFVSNRGKHVVVKSPEYASKAQMEYIANLYQEYEDAVYNDGVNPYTSKKLEEYIDLASLARCYLINEFTKNPDGFESSSYLYKDKGEDKFTAGPIWDYDLSMGVARMEEHKASENSDGWYTILIGRQRKLYEYKPFRETVVKEFEENLLPLLENRVLTQNTQQVEGVNSLEYYKQLVAQSAQCNYLVWEFDALSDKGGTFEKNNEYLENFVTQRTAWLKENLKPLFEKETPVLAEFADVTKDAWYSEAISNAVEKGYFEGYGNSAFLPDGNLTRSQIVKVLYTMQDEYPNDEKQTEGQTAVYQFVDVGPKAWYREYIEWSAKNNIIKGYSDGTFRPENPISIQDAILMMYRFLGCPAVNNNNLTEYADFEDISYYAYNAVCWAVENNMIRDIPEKTITPKANITRAQFCYMILNLPQK